MRRRFYELAAQGTSPVASEGLTRIAALYKVEADVRGASAEDRQKVRQERSAPLVQGLRQLLDARLGQLSRKSRLAEAIRYAVTRWDGLVLFLEDGRIELDNNSVERSIRPLALSRKNALFAGSDQGGEHWAVIAALIETCKLNKVNPEAWLTQTAHETCSGSQQPAARRTHAVELHPRRGLSTPITVQEMAKPKPPIQSRSSRFAEWVFRPPTKAVVEHKRRNGTSIESNAPIDAFSSPGEQY